jgi:hypothetical protein
LKIKLDGLPMSLRMDLWDFIETNHGMIFAGNRELGILRGRWGQTPGHVSHTQNNFIMTPKSQNDLHTFVVKEKKKKQKTHLYPGLG